MKNRLLAFFLILAVVCANLGSEKVFATDNTLEKKEITEDSETTEEYYELGIEELEESYEVGDSISIKPIMKRCYLENEEWLEEVIDNDRVSYELEYDSNDLEIIENDEDAECIYYLKRMSAKQIDISIAATITENEEVVDSLTETISIPEIDYEITLEGLRDEESTWLYVDEKEYILEVNREKIEDRDNLEVVWNVYEKESGNNVTDGCLQIKEEDKLLLNGEALTDNGYTGKTLVVSASVYSQGIETGASCQTEVEVRDTEVSLIKDVQEKQQLKTELTYGKTMEIYVENGKHPYGENLDLDIENIESSDMDIVEIIYDNKTKEWTLSGKDKGKVSVTFYLCDNDEAYEIKRKVEIVCDHLTTIKTLQIQQLLSQAAEWLGRKEADKSHRMIIDTYNAHKPLAIGYKVKYTDSWCATYVSAVSIKTGYTYLIPTECGCERMINLFKARGEWKENENCTPKAGWIIFYDWGDNGKGDNKGWSDHVGIVEKVSENKITVIEGNYSDKVKRRTISVNGRYIRGYGMPDYGKEIKRATTTKSGTITEGCALCDEKKTSTIPAASKISLSTTEYTYSGKVKTPKVTVKNSKNKKIDTSEYILTGSTSKKNVGKYSLTVQLNGKEYTGSKKLNYTIYPAAPSKVSAVLHGGHDDVKISWSKCTGADGYYVYYKKASASKYKKLTTTTKTSYKKKNLTDGTKYKFKIVPYFKDGNSKVKSINSKTATVYTLKRLKNVSVKKYSKTSVKVKWENISGESGYQISKSTIKVKKKSVVKTTKSSCTIKAARKKKYYYRVRAYKKVDGKTIYGPWSDPVSYKLK